MARLRNRMLKADFWSDGELLRWPREKRFTYAGLYSLAEDSGVLEDDPFTWKVMLWGSPHDADITVDKLELWRAELIESSKLIPFEAEGKELFFLRTFHEHEHPRNPQSPSLPMPPWVTWHPNKKFPHRGHYEVENIGVSRNGKPQTKSTAIAKTNGKKRADEEESFAVFWDYYPRKVERKRALSAWKRLNKEQRILATGVAQIMGMLKDKGVKKENFIPYPSTFLNGESWENWRDGVPVDWRDEEAERAEEQDAILDAAILDAYGEES